MVSFPFFMAATRCVAWFGRNHVFQPWRRCALQSVFAKQQSWMSTNTGIGRREVAMPTDGEIASPSQVDVSNTTRWQPAENATLKQLPGLYMELSKAKLTALVTLSTMCGYALAPGAADLNTMFCATVGTVLCATSANSINQWIEAPFDAQMSRTRTRVLVRRALSPLHAVTFGIGAGVCGVVLLASTVNGLTAFLGLSNILLYTCVYTPMKRTSIANTWAGAVVGAIPPMMGWAASTGSLDASAALLGFVLYAWQFPHFNALSWNLRGDYSKAGYRMASVVDPALNLRVAYRYALALIPVSFLAPWLGLTTWWFVDSIFVNAYLTYYAHQFYYRPSEQTARSLFFASLLHLPLILMLMLLHKKSKVATQKEEEIAVEEEST